MAKTNILLKRTTNALLGFLAEMEPQTPLMSASTLARTLNVSRTTIHGALRHLEEQKVIVKVGTKLVLVRQPKESDHFADIQVVGTHQRIEQVLMERMLRGGWVPEHIFFEADLARESGVSTAAVREFLIGFARYQLVEKRSRSGWRLLGLSMDFVNEVADMRYLIEMAAIKRVVPSNESHWHEEINTLLSRHHEFLGALDEHYFEFPILDRAFHTFLVAHAKNRFALMFIDIVSFVFYYHYKWNEEYQKTRVAASLGEHVAILQALRDADMELATRLLESHLRGSNVDLIDVLNADKKKKRSVSKV